MTLIILPLLLNIRFLARSCISSIYSDLLKRCDAIISYSIPVTIKFMLTPDSSGRSEEEIFAKPTVISRLDLDIDDSFFDEVGTGKSSCFING